MYIVELMAAPFAECIVLVAIHTYLGLHVLKRRVIFVDLALAQIAALGTTVGFLFGIMPDTSGALIFSMIFTFLGAAVFSVTRFRHETVPQEAVIGLSYAIACAVAILVVEKTQGAEHLKDILVGNLLWVDWSDVGAAAAVYAVIGGIHYVFREKFLLISDDPEAAYASGMPVRAWDFVFYLTFGAVITFSTRVAGVLLVFVFLVAPAILAFVLTSRMWLQLLVGWGTGTVVTVVGLYLSWRVDLPSGPAVIAFYGITLVLAGVVVYVVRAKEQAAALRSVLLGVAATGVVVLGVWTAGHWIGGSAIAVSEQAQQVAEEVATQEAAVKTRAAAQVDARESALQARLDRCVGGQKIERYFAMFGPEERLRHAETKISENARRGLEFLVIALADDDLPLLYRMEGVEILQRSFEDTFGYDPELSVAENEAAIARICDHIRALKRAAHAGVEGERASE